jgi:GNAT superfamily N-acetyltransferase
MPPAPLDRLVWHALATTHSHFRVGSNLAVRYPAEISPFAAVSENTTVAFEQLAALLDPNAPDDRVHIIEEAPAAEPRFKSALPPSLQIGPALETHQMFGPPQPCPSPQNRPPIRELNSANVQEMIALIAIAFPGFYKSETYKMGAYFGIRNDFGELVAMAGERLCILGCHEISGVCTHPAHTGKGYARALMLHLMQRHSNLGLKSFLHVGAKNTHALGVYQRLGFQITASPTLWPLYRAT